MLWFYNLIRIPGNLKKYPKFDVIQDQYIIISMKNTYRIIPIGKVTALHVTSTAEKQK